MNEHPPQPPGFARRIGAIALLQDPARADEAPARSAATATAARSSTAQAPARPVARPAAPREPSAGARSIVDELHAMRELIEDRVNGTLFAPDDPTACADALACLLSVRHDWENRRATARIFVESRHNWASNAERYLDVYQKQLRISPMNTIGMAG